MQNYLAVAALSAVCLASTSHAQVVNGGFETGDLMGWTVSGGVGSVSVFPFGHAGSWSCQFSSIISGQPGEISQAVAGVASGNIVTLEFWLSRAGSPVASNSLVATLGGVEVLNLLNTPSFGYTHYVFSGLVMTSATPTLTFRGFDPGNFGFFLDDIAMTVVTPIGCNPADIASVGQLPPPDGQLSADDFLAFFGAYFGADTLADIVSVGGLPPPDGVVSADDFLGFLNYYFQGC